MAYWIDIEVLGMAFNKSDLFKGFIIYIHVEHVDVILDMDMVFNRF